ncbi:MAG: hypothetical protein IIC35_05180 [Gemmatimonadetes bacterium]|nr:hypothetical protein [Gemmatimonadota bacterium]
MTDPSGQGYRPLVTGRTSRRRRPGGDQRQADHRGRDARVLRYRAEIVGVDVHVVLPTHGGITEQSGLHVEDRSGGVGCRAERVAAGDDQQRRWRQRGHRDLYQVVNRLAQETDDRSINVLFNSASALHSNFYENWMQREMVEDSLEQVREFVQTLAERP